MYMRAAAKLVAAGVAAGGARIACSQASQAKPAASSEKPRQKAESQPRTMQELMLQLAVKHRRVFVSGSIDDESAKSVVALLLYLEGAEPGAPITLLINSGGGKVQAGLAIHDVMRSLSSPVHTACLGHCESMAAVLLAAGEQGHRTALPNSRIMVHQPTRRSAGGQSKTSRQLQISAEETEKSRLKLAECLARDTGKTLPEIEALLENDSYYSAAEARAMGLVDAVGGAIGGGAVPPPPPGEQAGSAAAATG